MKKQLFCVIAAAFFSLPLPHTASAGNNQGGDSQGNNQGGNSQGNNLLVLTERSQTLTFDATTGNGIVTGTWVAAGAIEDTGTFTDDFHITPRSDGCGTLAATDTTVGSGGTLVFVVKTIRVCPFPFTTVPSYAVGPWTLVSGTDRYAGIQGQGELTSTLFNGELTLARNGEVSTN